MYVGTYLEDSCLCRWWLAGELLLCSYTVGLSAPSRLCLQGIAHLGEKWTHFSLSLLTPCTLVQSRRQLFVQTLAGGESCQTAHTL